MAEAAPKKIKIGGLFPCEAVIARRLSQTPAEWAAKAKVWSAMACPAIDPLWAGGSGPPSRHTCSAATACLALRSPNPMERRTLMPFKHDAPGLKTPAKQGRHEAALLGRAGRPREGRL